MSLKVELFFKNRVELAPLENESHSSLLEKLDIEDNEFNASKKFVRAELIPPEKYVITSDISKWTYKVDQDIVPEWYSNDPERYEDEFRESVKDFMNKHFKEEFGYYWTNIRMDGKIYHFMYGVLTRMSFGSNNNYAESSVRNILKSASLQKTLNVNMEIVLLQLKITCLVWMDLMIMVL